MFSYEYTQIHTYEKQFVQFSTQTNFHKGKNGALTSYVFFLLLLFLLYLYSVFFSSSLFFILFLLLMLSLCLICSFACNFCVSVVLWPFAARKTKLKHFYVSSLLLHSHIYNTQIYILLFLVVFFAFLFVWFRFCLALGRCWIKNLHSFSFFLLFSGFGWSEVLNVPKVDWDTLYMPYIFIRCWESFKWRYYKTKWMPARLPAYSSYIYICATTLYVFLPILTNLIEWDWKMEVVLLCIYLTGYVETFCTIFAFFRRHLPCPFWTPPMAKMFRSWRNEI